MGTGLSWRWVLLMAWRDSRRNRLKLLLFVLSIVFGLSALIAIRGFRTNVEESIHAQSKELLGADVEFRSRNGFTDDAKEYIESFGGIRSDEIRFSSMVLFDDDKGSRLVQVRAIEPVYPFYGKIITRPATAGKQMFEGDFALVDESLIHQYGLKLGDRIKLGNTFLNILGILDRVPGENAVLGFIAPRIYISKELLPQTGLLEFGSRSNWRVYLKLDDVEGLDKKLNKDFVFRSENNLWVDTVKKTEDNMGRSFSRVSSLLNLIGFMAIILGGVGVSSAVSVYLNGKTESVAILRCLGAKSSNAFAVYLVQISTLGLIAALIGSLIGIGIQYLIPIVLKDFLPFELVISFSWGNLLLGTLFGWLVCVLFTLWPLLPLRKISPLNVLRSAVEKKRGLSKDPWVYGVGIALLTTLYGFGYTQTDSIKVNSALTFGVVGLIFGLALVAWISLKLLKWLVPNGLPFAARYGIANLYRPNNRTVLMVVALGIGFILVLTLYLVKEGLLKQLIVDRDGSGSNMIFYDIQIDQIDEVESILAANEMPVIETTPLVNMRIESVKGVPVKTLLKRDPQPIPVWTLVREYRSTFRDTMTDAETLTEGRFEAQGSLDNEPVSVTVEKGLAKDLDIGVGDRVVFDVQGLPIETEIVGIRGVDWNQVRANFFFVFPAGVLEDAPQFYITATHSPDNETTARIQRAIVGKHPNISAIDLRSILKTLDGVLSKISWVIEFMAMFTILAGLVVLAGTIATSRYQRVKESVLLRTLGASGTTIKRVLLIEFLAIGMLAALVGGVSSVVTAGVLMKFMFKLPIDIAWGKVLIGMGIMVVLTAMTGLLSSRGITNRSPLEILREE